VKVRQIAAASFPDNACPHPHKRKFDLTVKSPCSGRQGLFAFLAKHLLSKNGINGVTDKD
jgi:hypothetical protein